MRRSSAPVHRGITVLLATCLATLGLLVSGMAVAQAHDELVGSSPEAGATLDAAPPQVELEFSGEIQELGTEVVVTSEDGSTVSDGAVRVDGSTVAQPLTADLPAGSYTVDWRATSADGHPLSDSFSFTVAGDATTGAAAGSSAPAPAPATTDVGEASAASPADPSSNGMWIAGIAAGVLLVAAVVAVRSLRRRS
jgi:methionine-rich copper-binding protein CopC